MSASKEIKKVGLKSLQFVADKADVKRNSLQRWYHSNPDRFIAIVYGVKSRVDKGEIE